MADDNDPVKSEIAPLSYSPVESSAIVWNKRARTSFRLVSFVQITPFLWLWVSHIHRAGAISLLRPIPWLLGYWLLGDMAHRGSYRKTLIVTASCYLLYFMKSRYLFALHFIKSGASFDLPLIILLNFMLVEMVVWVYIIWSLVKSALIPKSTARQLLPDHENTNIIANSPEAIEKKSCIFWRWSAALSFWLIAAVDLVAVLNSPDWWSRHDFIPKSLVLGLAGVCVIKSSHLKMLFVICLSMVMIGFYDNLSRVMPPFYFMLRIMKILFAVIAVACIGFMLTNGFIKGKYASSKTSN